ncbi:hypothetical protein ACHAW5_006063 [Stephanodiscus triporus]|uniref:Uncharacterized protein n=1 Tax=Stephanodiscus triporus TaxID=2934178 RepID=A0ABD3QBD5_9STRA
MHGKSTIHFSGGEVYYGEWVNDKYNGTGMYKWVDRSEYVGEFKGGNPNGKGEFANGHVYMESEARANGHFKWVNGDKYVGEFKDNIGNRNGMMKYSNGNVYDGEWGKGKRNGTGT